MTDELALWEAVLRGDSRAFAQVFDLHRDAAFRQALRVVTEPADAEEVVAAAFFALWRRRVAVRMVQSSVLPWLLVTVSNLGRNSHRALVRRESLLRRLPREHDDAEDIRRFERIDELALRQDLLAALRRLPAKDVALVTMTALDGYPLKEVAELLGLTENAARVRLHRARRRLQADLVETAPGQAKEATR